MALLGPELLVLLILLIILFRPRTITEISRGLGRLVGEFKRGGSEEKRRKLVKVAEDLGIDPKGKSEEELLEEIRRKLFA
ncbi:MAG: twin-arginine translocase TatA/TatE family subunit [Thaumarchaeota archaeon]|nr:twin-arginine translocase TatA/TatE family subunit [Nitrososphaerota archaeon]